MQLRPSARLLAAVGALLLATTLSSCGFGYATDRVYTQANGVNERDADVDVLNALIVSGQEGSGTFIASFANNNQTDDASVDEFAGGGEDTSLEAPDFAPIKIEPGRLVNLADTGGIVVTGDLAAGHFVTVTMTFSTGETVELDVPIVTDCGVYEGMDTSAADSDSGSTEDQCAVETPESSEH
jgi:hypothetical protein